MRIEQSTNFTMEIVLESGESISVRNDDSTYRLDLEYGDSHAPDAENKVKAEVIHIRSVQ